MRTKITQICFTYTDSCCFSRKDKFLLKNRYAEAKRENAPAYRNYGKLKKMSETVPQAQYIESMRKGNWKRKNVPTATASIHKRIKVIFTPVDMGRHTLKL